MWSATSQRALMRMLTTVPPTVRQLRRVMDQAGDRSGQEAGCEMLAGVGQVHSVNAATHSIFYIVPGAGTAHSEVHCTMMQLLINIHSTAQAAAGWGRTCQ